ncbi:TMEM165/GDT1 family protein [Nocardia sp. NPDC051570]|uniref:TMEM165/GDT1 family protein n=1 Tax=Nocardia sp. NPDC051570 TaxID=3364324 RepID=UPI0037AECE84
MIATILLSFGVLFLAELGDKSQLMALTFALRYRWWVVLSGIAVASVAVNLIAVAVGHFLGAALPTNLIALITAVILLGVGVWTLREVHSPEAETEQPRHAVAPNSGRALFVVISAFLLAELGDRTMFATIALASQHGWFGVWLGSVVGMVAAGGLAIAIGITVGKHIPERAIALGSGLLFLYIGAATLLSTFEMGRVAEMGLAAVAPLAAGLILWLLRRRDNRVDPAPSLTEQH